MKLTIGSCIGTDVVPPDGIVLKNKGKEKKRNKKSLPDHVRQPRLSSKRFVRRRFVFVRGRSAAQFGEALLFAANDDANFMRGHREAIEPRIFPEVEDEDEEEREKGTFVPRCSPRHVRVGLRLRIPFNYAQ